MQSKTPLFQAKLKIIEAKIHSFLISCCPIKVHQKSKYVSHSKNVCSPKCVEILPKLNLMAHGNHYVRVNSLGIILPLLFPYIHQFLMAFILAIFQRQGLSQSQSKKYHHFLFLFLHQFPMVLLQDYNANFQ